MNEELNIALCTDDNYASHCAICISSILENNKNEDCHVYVLTDGLNKENEEKFRQLSKHYSQRVDIKTLNISIFDSLQETNRLGRSMYFRFMLPELVEGERVLYLDCDIIVRHSLNALFNTDLTDTACGVVEDQCGDDIRLHNPIRMFSRYFNSGVLLMNLDYWRKHDVVTKLKSWIEHFEGRLLCPDQDALNVVLEGKVKFLDYRYNFQQGFYGSLDWLRADKWPSVHESRKDPVILHFTSGEKPWHKDCVHPLKGEYDYYMSLHDFLKEPKNRAYGWHYYVVESIVGKLKLAYQLFRRRNGQFTY